MPEKDRLGKDALAIASPYDDFSPFMDAARHMFYRDDLRDVSITLPDLDMQVVVLAISTRTILTILRSYKMRATFRARLTHDRITRIKIDFGTISEKELLREYPYIAQHITDELLQRTWVQEILNRIPDREVTAEIPAEVSEIVNRYMKEDQSSWTEVNVVYESS